MSTAHTGSCQGNTSHGGLWHSLALPTQISPGGPHAGTGKQQIHALHVVCWPMVVSPLWYGVERVSELCPAGVLVVSSGTGMPQAQSSAGGWRGELGQTCFPCVIPAACLCRVSLKAEGMRLQPIDCHACVVQKTALMCCSDHSRAEHHCQLFTQTPSPYIWVLCKLSVKQTIFLILFSHAMGFSLRGGVGKKPSKLLKGRKFFCSCL